MQRVCILVIRVVHKNPLVYFALFERRFLAVYEMPNFLEFTIGLRSPSERHYITDSVFLWIFQTRLYAENTYLICHLDFFGFNDVIFRARKL